MVNKKSVSKKLIAILLAVVLVIGTLPVGFASVFAAIKNGYTISIKDYDYSGVVTLIDKNNADNKFTQEMTKGKAKFDNLDDETAYSLKITNLYGYEDYSNDNFVPSDNLFELGNADLKAIDTVKVSGKIVDEKGVEVENLEFTYAPAGFTDISFNGKTDNDGKYSFDVYKDVEYSLTFNVDNKKYNEVKKTVNVSNDIDFGDEQLSLKQFSISATVSGNGGNITGNYTMIDYGNDLQKDTIVASANENYVIETLTVDGNPIKAAIGKEKYDLSNVSALKNVKDTHSVSVSFYRPTYEITIKYNKNGTVKNDRDELVSSGGKVTLQQGGKAGFTAIANENYHISKVEIDNDVNDNFNNSTTKYSKTFDDNKAHSVTITFAINTFNVTVKAGENGTVTANPTTVDYDGSTVITIKPKKDYEIETLKINGKEIPKENITETKFAEEYTYTINNVQEDKKVDVTFVKQQYVRVENILDNEYYTVKFIDNNNNEIEPVIKGNDYIIPGTAKLVVTPKSPTYCRTSINSNVLYTNKTSTVKSNLKIEHIDVDTDNLWWGWTKVQAPINLVLDSTGPKIKNITKTPDQDYYNKAYNISFGVTDDIAGVDSVYYGTENDITKAKEATFDSASGKASFTTTDDEFYGSYYIWAKDKVGNKSSTSVKINIDKTAPVIDSFEITNATNNVKTTSFGTFSSSKVIVKVKAHDIENSPTNTEGKNTCSGVQSITFNNKETNKKETKNVDKNNEAIFEIDEAADLKLEDFSVKDNVGNETTGVVASGTNATINTGSKQATLLSNKLTISTVKPTVTIVKDNNGATTGLVRHDETTGKVWFNGNANFIVTVTDELGINTIKVKLNGQDVETSSDSLTLKDVDFSNSGKITTKSFKINTAMFPSSNANGENTLEVITNNVSNNYNKEDKSAEKSYLYIDTTAPTVDTFEFKAKNTNFLSKTLNFLTFGIFFNEEIDVTIAASDANASSGLKSITLYAGDNEVETIDVDNVATDANTSDKCTFTLKMADYDANQIISAIATDKVGNASAKTMPDTNNSNILEENGKVSGVDNPGLMIETVAPEATITCPTPAQNKNSATGDSNDWYPGDVDLTIDIWDPKDNGSCSGIRNIAVSQKVGDKFEPITVDAKGNKIKQDYYNDETKTDKKISLTLNTSTLKANPDGSYTIKVEATDNAGNVMGNDMKPAVIKTIYKDISVPTVKDFKFTSKGYAFDKSVENANTAPVEETSYGYYFIKDTEVTVTADDAKPTSGVKSITYYTVDKDGVKSEEKTELVNKDNQITFTVKANFKGQIYAKACDNVGHTPSTFSKPNGAVIESPDLHTQTSAIKYTLKDSKDSNGADIKDEKGNNLYGADTTVDVEVADTYSGIRRIDWEIVSPFDDKKQAGTVTVDNNGKVTSVAKKGYSDDCLGDWVATGEANTNLVVNLKNTIKVSNDSNDIKIKFTLTDRAGNVTKDVVQTLSIDKTAPKIAVQMNENDDNEFNGYFKGSREADIYVYERNFSQSDVVFDVKRTDDNNKQTNVSPKPKFKYVGTQVIDGRECFVYKMTTKFKADGDYNFKVSASDITSHIANAESVNFKSDNKSVKFSSDKTAEYTSQNDTDRAIDVSFTIDNTNPVVSVSYDNNTAANEKYFNAYRTATLTVVEHNFSTAASRIIYKRTSAKDGANINEPAVSSWSRKGNTYTATIKYNADGDYTFDMQVIDKAGNKDKGVKYNGTAAKDFTVDTTIAKPSIKGVENGKSYKASVLPSISFNDINIANSEIKLLRTRKNEINKDVTSDFIKISKNAKGGSFKANEETFKKLQENDGIYTLSVNISDKAGNKSSETVKFTVNRFGSVYALNKYLVNDLNNSYVQSIDNNLVITEYNPDKLVKGKLDVVVTRDGSPVDFGDGQLTVNPVVNSTVQIGQSGWYQYNYTISKDLFTDDNGKAIDGIYKIYVASEDEVGNKSENINYKDADIMFRLDTTAPSLKSVAGLEKSVVNAAKLDVNYEIFDSIGLKSIDVYYVNENGIDAVDHIRSKDSKEENVAGYIEDVTSYKGKFTIGECTKENVRFVITDLAGNVTDTGDTNNKAVNFDSSSLDFNSTITVSTNPLTRWYAHTVLFWCSIAVIAVALGAIGFVVATKLRKKEEKATEDYKNSKKNK